MRGKKLGTLIWVAAILRSPCCGFAADEENPFAKVGPYAVGVRTFVLVDDGRKDETTGGPRTLVTEAWYPAADEARSLPKMHFPEFFGPYQAEATRALKRDPKDIDAGFSSLAARGAPARATGAKGEWPLVVFSHGNGGFRAQNAFQMEHLASHGYCVLSPDHTGNASLSPLPDQPVRHDRKARGRSAEDRPRDVRFLIDRALAADRPEVEWLRGRVDPRAIAVAGHSFGGFTAVKLVEEDPRIRAIIPMTVAFIARPTAIPTLVMLGAEDSTVGKAGNLASRGYYLGCTGPRNLLILLRGGHFTFTEMGLINPNFGDGIGRGKSTSGEPMEFIPIPMAKEIINAYTLAFLERHLRGSEGARRFLDANRYPQEIEWWIGDRQVSGPITGGGKPPPPTGDGQAQGEAGSGPTREF